MKGGGNVPAKWDGKAHKFRSLIEQMDGLGDRPRESCPECKSDFVRTIILRQRHDAPDKEVWRLIFTGSHTQCPCCSGE